MANAHNVTCGTHSCSLCELCDPDFQQCVARPCFSFPSEREARACHCEFLSKETLIAVGGVLLCMVVLLVAMGVWHWNNGCCSDHRSTFMRTGQDHTEGLISNLNAQGHRVRFSRFSRGRTSLDSTISCVVCMDGAIDCVLMPCAHEVACHRCASRLADCPICRNPVASTLKIISADEEQMARARAIAGARVDAATRSPPCSDAELPNVAAAEAGDAEAAPATASGEVGVVAVDKPGVAPAPLPTMLCLRCAASPANCIFLPCSHKVWCTGCAAQVRACPPTHTPHTHIPNLSVR